MIATVVHVHVKEAHVNAFIAATAENHRNSIQEVGNFRFDVLQEENDPCKFILYEVYETEQAATAHKQTSHYLKWRDAVAAWMVKPRQGVKHKLLLPKSLNA